MTTPTAPQASRRTVLKRGLLGGALLTVGGSAFLAFRGSRLEPVPKEGLLVVSETGYAVLVALSRRFIPDKKGLPSADALRVALAVDRIISWTDPSAQVETNQLLGLFENALAGFLFGRWTRPFTQLSSEEQDQVLDEWRTSGIPLRRTGYLALRTLVTSGYYGNKETWTVSRYPGPPAGVHQPDAPLWKGGETPRPPGNGVWSEPSPAAPEAPPPDAPGP